MDSIKYFFYELGQKNSKFPIEKRFYNLFTFNCGWILLIVSVPVNFYLNLSLLVQLATLSLAFFSLICLSISFFKDIQYMKLFNLVALVGLDFIWFGNAGSYGATIVFLGIHMIYTIVLLKGNIRMIFSAINIINGIGLLLAEKYFPLLTIPYKDIDERFIDHFVSYGIAGVFLFLMINDIMNNYERERKQSQRQKVELEELSLRDPLTGLYNRRYQMARLKEEMQNYTRYAHPLSIIMIDIDFFKLVNDTWGHGEGDIILQKFANILTENLRINDISGRYGGEEFLVILPMTKLSEAILVAEKLRSSTENHLLRPDGRPTTLSIGVEEYRNQSESEFIADADEKLYFAKQTGRNKVVAVI